MSAKKDFKIPKIIFHAYSPRKNRYYTLSTPLYKITVKKIPTATLLDKEEYPQIKSFINLTTLKQFFIYSLIFFLGFITAKVSLNHKSKKKKQKQFQDIQECSSSKELIIILLDKYRNKNINNFIKQLESLEYEGKGNFKVIQKAILQKISLD
jgi:5-methylthioribose kinase